VKGRSRGSGLRTSALILQYGRYYY